jgi:hypothetical protein
MKSDSATQRLRLLLCGLGLVTALGVTGCQSSIGGQVLPSPYYLEDDVQYYAPATEFRLAREAAKMKEYKAELELQRAQQRR